MGADLDLLQKLPASASKVATVSGVHYAETIGIRKTHVRFISAYLDAL